MDPCPVIGVFGVSPMGQRLAGGLQANAVAFMTLLARRMILRQWKSEKPPPFKLWVKEVLSMIPLEKLRYSRSGSKDKYVKTWTPFIDFVESIPFT